MTDAKVVKIRPSWDHVKTDDDGNMFFEYGTTHQMDLRKRTSDKIIKEMESKRIL